MQFLRYNSLSVKLNCYLPPTLQRNIGTGTGDLQTLLFRRGGGGWEVKESLVLVILNPAGWANAGNLDSFSRLERVLPGPGLGIANSGSCSVGHPLATPVFPKPMKSSMGF